MAFMSKGTGAHGQDGAVAPERAAGSSGLTAGCRVMTLDGELPVEFLAPGDRIVTRDGMRRLLSVSVTAYTGRAVRLAEGALGHNRPETGLTLPAGTRIRLRDWRARAMFGTAEGDAPVARLFDGQYVTETEVRGMRVYDLVFDTPQVIYAEGLEIACGAAPGSADAAAEARPAAFQAGSRHAARA